MPHSLSSSAVFAIFIAFVLFHVALVVSATFYRKINPILLLAGAFILLSPISAAPGLSVVEAAKWGRVYAAMLMVVIGILGYQIVQIGAASKLLMGFVGLYVLAAMWGPAPVPGLIYKGLFGMAVVAGMFMVYSIRDRVELSRAIRWIAMIGGLAGLVLLAVFLQNPKAMLNYSGRLMIAGLNPNRIGQTAAPMVVLCSYLAFHDPSKFWKAFGYFMAGSLTVIILYTGSRAAAASAVFGCFIVALPLIKRPVQAMAVAMVLAMFTWASLHYIEAEAVERLTSAATLSKSTEELASTRALIWSNAMKSFRKSPLIGEGWIKKDEGASTVNLHSMYLQTMAETGLVGTFMLLLSFLFPIFRGFRFYVTVRRNVVISNLLALPLGLLVLMLAHGIGESGTLMGSTLNSLFLGFSVAMIDRLPELSLPEMGYTPLDMQYPGRVVRRQWERGSAGPEVAT